MSELARDARTVLLPAFSGTALSDDVRRFLGSGGLSILVGESREEYVGRAMSRERVESESAETFISLTSEARQLAGSLLVAIDQELGGICRLHKLAPKFPPAAALLTTSPDEIERIAYSVALRATEMGVNVFLAPILDVVLGSNPWLAGRTWSTDIDRIGTLSAAYIRGVQRGGVAATGKHFPGFSHVTGDPAVDASVVTVTNSSELKKGMEPFRQAIAASVEMIMVGPAAVLALDPNKAALRSKSVVRLLKQDLGFEGIVMADDLDAKATLSGDPIEVAAIDALNAGCDFLMLADTGHQIEEVAKAIEMAASNGIVSRDLLARSAQRLRTLCHRYDIQQ